MSSTLTPKPRDSSKSPFYIKGEQEVHTKPTAVKSHVVEPGNAWAGLQRNPTPKPRKILSKERYSPMLSKLRPTKISVEKERLYIENMALKVKVNDLQEMLTKHKAKITQLEREVQKKEEITQSSSSTCNRYLVKLLKQNIKDLRSEVQAKNQEIIKQKQNMKLTKFVEMELEVKAYMDECTRLRHYLEEVIKEKEEEDSTIQNTEINDLKTVSLLKIIEENNKEIQKLKDKLKSDSSTKGSKTPKYQEEFSKLSKELEVLKKKLSKKEQKHNQEIESFKKKDNETQKLLSVEKIKLEEANILIENLCRELKSLRQKKKSKITPPLCLTVLYEITKKNQLSIQEYLAKFSQGNSLCLETKDLLTAMQAFDSSITQESIEGLLPYVKSENSSKISIKRLADYFNTYDFSEFSLESKSSKTLELFEHLSLRMQLHRIPKENLIEALIGAGVSSSKSIHSQEIVLLFTNSPFDFTRKQASIMVEYLFNNSKTQSYSAFIDKFYASIQDWEVFTAKDEENFDSYLLSLVGKYKDYIYKYCTNIDKEDKSVVTVKCFFECLESQKIVVTERIRDYLLVLFYSHNMELNSVPYKQFIQAYSGSQDSIAPEDAKTGLVQKYLDQISSKMIELRKSARETFPYDENGFIVAEDFIQGLNSLKIEEIPKENLLVLLEALQYDPEARVVCIHIDELEEILETYGVQTESNMNISEIISDSEVLAEITEGHVQKISLLDSAQLDLSETPEPGPRTSRVSFGNNF